MRDAVHRTGPFGLVGTTAAVLAAAGLYPESCGPSASDVARADVALLVAVPVAWLLVGWFLGAVTRRRTVWSVVLATLATVAVLVTMGLAATGNPSIGLFAFGYVALPFAGAWIAALVLARVTPGPTPLPEPARALVDPMNGWRVAATGSLAIAAAVGSLSCLRIWRPLVPAYAIAGAVLVLALVGVLAAVAAWRRGLLARVERTHAGAPKDDRPPAVEAAYRDPAWPRATPDLDALRAHVRRDRDALVLGAFTAVVAVASLLFAPAPPPVVPERPIASLPFAGC